MGSVPSVHEQQHQQHQRDELGPFNGLAPAYPSGCGRPAAAPPLLKLRAAAAHGRPARPERAGRYTALDTSPAECVASLPSMGLRPLSPCLAMLFRPTFSADCGICAAAAAQLPSVQCSRILT